MKPEVRWPLFIVALLLLQVGVGVFFFWKATSDRSFAVEEDYYRKAVDWESRQAQDRVNAKLGWRLEHTVGHVTADGHARALQARFFAPDGSPLTGLSVQIETFHNVRAGDVLRTDLVETAPGVYGDQIAMLRPGLWEIRFTAERGDTRFTHRARTHVPVR